MNQRRHRRQIGADTRDRALPPIPAPASDRKVALSRLAILVTTAAWLAYVVRTLLGVFVIGDMTSIRSTIEACTYVVVVTMLTYSALAYLVARQGYLFRTRTHHRTPRAQLDEFFDHTLPTMTVLVPSYREDARVIRQSLLSAALQEYPYLRLVLLIDDPPEPTDPAHVSQLEAARAVVTDVQALLDTPRARFEALLAEYERTSGDASAAAASELSTLAAAYDEAAAWLRELGERHHVVDHSDRFFVREVVGRLVTQLDATAEAVRSAAADGTGIPAERVHQLYRRLAWVFRAELSSFERKRYVSLPDEPNKAMNLNAYLSLMGGSFDEMAGPEGTVLVPSRRAKPDVVVPDPDYVLTLDADSLLLPEYCLRLVHVMEQPQNARVAVAQTPYSSFPGSTTRLERLAGATTDLQHILHQGLTHYDATFWVGANAVIRKAALEDIAEYDARGPFVFRRFVQDRTVIEDTESSIDLAVHGWMLFNYPERLSYSATPPDFGSLCIQRQRWANGGLLILPKLLRNGRERRRSGTRGRLTESFLRFNYMASICWASVGLLLLLAYPFDDDLLSPLVVLAAVPYFLAQASDLKASGYKRLDVLRIYGFNLILLAVNLSGSLKSLGQALTGRKIAFARTPKVRSRTTAAASFVVLPYVLVIFSGYTLTRDIHAEHYGHAVFAGFNAALTAYAIVAYIGLRNSVVDLWVNLVQRLYRPERDPGRQHGDAALVVDQRPWEEVLYYGADRDDHTDPATTRRTVAAIARPSLDANTAPPRRVEPVLELTDDSRRLDELLERLLRDSPRPTVRVQVDDVSIDLDPVTARQLLAASPPPAHQRRR